MIIEFPTLPFSPSETFSVRALRDAAQAYINAQEDTLRDDVIEFANVGSRDIWAVLDGHYSVAQNIVEQAEKALDKSEKLNDYYDAIAASSRRYDDGDARYDAWKDDKCLCL